MLTKTTVMKFLLRIQLVEIQLLTILSKINPPPPPWDVIGLEPDPREAPPWWWWMVMIGILMIFDMGMKLMMLLMMMIPLPEQHCHQPNVLPPKHTRSEMKQSVALPPLLTARMDNWKTPAPLSERSVWERKCHNVFPLSLFSEKFWRVSRAAHGRTILHCLAASLASTTQDTNTKTKMIKTHKHKHQHKTQN